MKIKFEDDEIKVEMSNAHLLMSLSRMVSEKMDNQAVSCILAALAKIANEDGKMFHRVVMTNAALAASYVDDVEFSLRAATDDLDEGFIKAREAWKEARLENKIDEAKA